MGQLPLRDVVVCAHAPLHTQRMRARLLCCIRVLCECAKYECVLQVLFGNNAGAVRVEVCNVTA